MNVSKEKKYIPVGSLITVTLAKTSSLLLRWAEVDDCFQ